MRTWLLAAALSGCAWLDADELDAFLDPDGDGEPAAIYGGRDCFPEDGDRTLLRCHADTDADGYGDPNEFTDEGCACAVAAVANALDCDDDDAGLHPETAWYEDADGDGFGALSTPAEQACEPSTPALARETGDCDDEDPEVHPGVRWFVDRDGDGYGDPEAPVAAACGEVPDPPGGADAVTNGEDCDDDDERLLQVWYELDGDGDGFAPFDAPVAGRCAAATPPAGAIPRGDCDDADPALHPDTEWFPDEDGDGHGARVPPVVQCGDPGGNGAAGAGGWVPTDALDCDDQSPEVHAGADEGAVGDGVDQDCDGFDLRLACGTPPPIDVSPGDIDARLASLQEGDCAALRLAAGTYGPLTVAVAVEGLALAGDAYGEVVLDGAFIAGRTAIEADAGEFQLEHLALRDWSEGVLETVSRTQGVGLRGVDVSRSGPLLRERVLQGEELALERLDLLDVTFTDGEGLARALAVGIATVRDVTFDGTISATPLIGIRDAGTTSVLERITVLRSASSGPLLSFAASPGESLALAEVEIADSQGSAGLVVAGHSVVASRIRVEDSVFDGGFAGLGIDLYGREGSVTLDRASVRRNRVGGAGPSQDQWVSVDARGPLEVSATEIVGNVSRESLALLRLKRAEASTADIRLDRVALHAAMGTAVVLEDAGPVTVAGATVVGFDVFGDVVRVEDDVAFGVDIPVVEVRDSLFVTDAMPMGITLVDSEVYPRFEPRSTPLVLYGPTVHYEFVDLRWSPRARADEIGAYAGLVSTCDGWDLVDDCDGDGLYDSWERYFLGTLAETGTGDRDADGLLDSEEHDGGTIPVDEDTDDDGAPDGSDAFPLGPPNLP
jgi:hypothetical protein